MIENQSIMITWIVREDMNMEQKSKRTILNPKISLSHTLYD